jgi:osmotically-inducible protein OsmY
MSDLSLQQDIMQALADNPLVRADEIAVEVRNGDVVVRGTVGTEVQHEEAARTVRAVPGIHEVDVRLDVRLMGPEARADADTEAAVLDALIADRDVHASTIDVDAHGDSVTISGLVELDSQRERAERIALGVGGVSHVRNELRVWQPISADDVAARVTAAVGGGGDEAADHVTVSVREADVVLTGHVSSAEHRDAALAAAGEVPGVADVHDHLSVRAPLA